MVAIFGSTNLYLYILNFYLFFIDKSVKLG